MLCLNLFCVMFKPHHWNSGFTTTCSTPLIPNYHGHFECGLMSIISNLFDGIV